MGRKLGIDIAVEVPWGSHFAFFYEIKRDLIEIAVPFLRSGLDNHELCLWVTEGFTEGEAEQILMESLPDFGNCRQKKQIEIISNLDWYLEGGDFDANKILKKFSDKHEQAMANGWDGFRAIADLSWAGREQWKRINAYECDIDALVEKHNMLVVCTYSFKECDPDYIIHILTSHQLGILKSGEDFEIIETSSIKIKEKMFGN